MEGVGLLFAHSKVGPHYVSCEKFFHISIRLKARGSCFSHGCRGSPVHWDKLLDLSNLPFNVPFRVSMSIISHLTTFFGQMSDSLNYSLGSRGPE